MRWKARGICYVYIYTYKVHTCAYLNKCFCIPVTIQCKKILASLGIHLTIIHFSAVYWFGYFLYMPANTQIAHKTHTHIHNFLFALFALAECTESRAYTQNYIEFYICLRFLEESDFVWIWMNNSNNTNKYLWFFWTRMLSSVQVFI